MQRSKKDGGQRGRGRLQRSSSKPVSSDQPSTWQVQIAKARFSELVERARSNGPQYVTRNGRPAVVVIAIEEFERLSAKPKRKESFADFLMRSPLVGSGINLTRQRDYGRPVDL
jgi:prevent-host-death family protein